MQLSITVEMTDEQVRSWAEEIGIDAGLVEADVAAYLRVVLKEETVSKFWKTEIH